MARIIAYTYTSKIEVAIEAEIYQIDTEDQPCVMVRATNSDQVGVHIPLTADQADEVAREIAALAAELHAMEVPL